MRKTIGKAVIIDTKPPYRPWDGNQATILFFSVFVAFVLTLLSGLSEPIIRGLYTVKVDSGTNGTLSIGTWGFCVRNAPGIDNFCSGNRGFGGNLIDVEKLPEGLKSLREVVHALPSSYLIATGVFHMFGALATWLTVTWTLAASGAWHTQDPNGWNWTRWSFHGTGASAVFVLIAWALDLRMITRVAWLAINVDGSQPFTTPGPAVWMMMKAFVLCFVTYLVRVFYSRRLPRPTWSIKGASEVHDANLPPLSAALPPPQDLPPRWEDLNIHSPNQILSAEDEKAMLEEIEPMGPGSHGNSVDQAGFQV